MNEAIASLEGRIAALETLIREVLLPPAGLVPLVGWVEQRLSDARRVNDQTTVAQAAVWAAGNEERELSGDERREL